jgi:hypothetical protein
MVYGTLCLYVSTLMCRLMEPDIINFTAYLHGSFDSNGVSISYVFVCMHVYVSDMRTARKYKID